MKWTFSVLFIICLIASTSVLILPAKASADSWTTMAPLPMAFTSSGAAVVDGKVYVIGVNTGVKPGNETYNFQYDPNTNTWIAKTPMPTFRIGFAVAACQNKVYVMGGFAGIGATNASTNEVYDPATDSWERKAYMPTDRIGMGANVLDGKLYIIGGSVPNPFDVSPLSKANEAYDPSKDSWTEMAQIPTAVTSYASAVIDDKIYVIGGSNSTRTDLPNVALNLVQIFDPETNQWSQGAHVSAGIFGAAACATTGLLSPKRIYVIGGEVEDLSNSFSALTNVTQVYDPQTESWSFGASIPTARSDFALVNVNDTFYAIGGVSGYILVSANEKYTPLDYGASSSPSPSQNPTFSPTQSPTPSISPSENSTGAPIQTPRGLGSQEFVAEITLAVALAIVLAVAFALMRKHKPK